MLLLPVSTTAVVRELMMGLPFAQMVHLMRVYCRDHINALRLLEQPRMVPYTTVNSTNQELIGTITCVVLAQ